MSKSRQRNWTIVTIQMQNKKIKELEQQVKDMKCCGNCKYFDIFLKREGKPYLEHETIDYDCSFWENGDYQDPKGFNYYCKNWQFDGLSQKEREGYE